MVLARIFAAMKLQYKLLLIVVCLTMMSTFSYGQLNNSFFDIERPDTSEGAIDLHIESLGYFRNVEYESIIDEGRTLFGYQFWPELTYQVSEKAQVAAGLFLQRDFGGDGFYQSTPTFSFQYNNKGHFLRFGTLIGSSQHQLIEPLYDPERIIENRLENGFQYKLNKKRLEGELWADWRKMIYQNSPFREEFTVGLRVEPKLINTEKTLLSLPVSMLAFHKGGEIDTSKLPTMSNYNFDYGLKYVVRPAGAIDSIDIQLHALYYEDVSSTPENYIDGLGQYVSIAAYRKQFGVMLNYWDAHQFHNPMGDVVYRTVSMQNPTYILDYRKLFMARIFWEKPIADNLNFLFRANYMYDVNQQTHDVVAEFYIRWNPVFGIATIR